MPNDPPTNLSDELYELATGDGATPAAIREKPALMSLQYIRAETPSIDGEALDGAVAARVRAFLEEASYALEEPTSQRDDKDADRGAAARCLLGLYPGTGSMLLAERRKYAANHLVKKVRTTTKRRERNGKMTSHEMLLMGQLATELWDRETDFLKQREIQFLKDSQAAPSEPPNSPLLAGVSELHEVAQELHSTMSYLTAKPRSAHREGFDVESLCLLGRFSQLVNIEPEEGELDGWADPILRALLLMSPTRTVAAMFSLIPFERDTIDLMGQVDFSASSFALLDFVYDLMPQWHAWLRLCVCDRAEPQADCPVHRFQTLLNSYIGRLDDCWRELRDPYHSPRSYKVRTTPARIIREYSLNPAIDK
jgi:hypothetical protein